MHVHLLVPDLLAGLADVHVEAAEILLARGRRSRATAATPEAWLAARYALQGDDSAGAFSLLGEGVPPGPDWWLRADPVHLHVGRDGLVLDSCALALSPEEARELASGLNAHFAAELQIRAVHPLRWYACAAAHQDIRCTPLAEARGKPISRHLPSGADAMHWHAHMNDAQMLLNEHAINAEREARGELPVNSVWFWGAGRLMQPSVRPFDWVLSDDPLARGLAQASGGATATLGADARSWLSNMPDAGRVLAVLDTLVPAAACGSADEWARCVALLERDWFAPLLAALRAGRIGMLSLHCPGPSGTLGVETTRLDVRRFWRRCKALSSYAGTPAH